MLESGQFVFGPNVSAFEREAADFLDVPETIGVANGTDAIVLVLDALGDRPRRRGDLPLVHLLRNRRGDRAPRGDARLRRHRPGDAEPRPPTCERKITPRTKAILPVHLFGRPAPLAELAGLGAADRRGRRAGVRLARHRRHRNRVDLQLLSDEEPLRPRGRRPRRRARRRARRAHPHAPLPRLEGEEDVRVRRLQLAARRDPGRRAADLPARARRLDGRAPRGGSALRRPRPRGAVRDPGRRARPCVPPLRLPLARARPDPRGAQRGARSETPSTTCRRCTCSLPCATSATRRERCPRRSEPPRENFSVPLWAGITAEQQERVVDVVRAAVGVASAR